VALVVLLAVALAAIAIPALRGSRLDPAVALQSESRALDAPPAATLRLVRMSPSALAIFVVVSFLVPVPVLAWLDRPRPKDRD